MFSSILLGLAAVVTVVLNIVQILVIVSVGITWFNADPYNTYVQLVRRLTEPMYRPFRRWTNKIGGNIDITPMLVIFVIIFLQKSVPTYLYMLAQDLK